MTTKTKATAFVDRTRNMFGPLTGECRARLEAVIAKPTQKTWDNAFSLIVGKDGFTTLWQAWVKVDADAPRSKPYKGRWPRIPDQLTLYRALKAVT